MRLPLYIGFQWPFSWGCGDENDRECGFNNGSVSFLNDGHRHKYIPSSKILISFPILFLSSLIFLSISAVARDSGVEDTHPILIICAEGGGTREKRRAGVVVVRCWKWLEVSQLEGVQGDRCR